MTASVALAGGARRLRCPLLLQIMMLLRAALAAPWSRLCYPLAQCSRCMKMKMATHSKMRQQLVAALSPRSGAQMLRRGCPPSRPPRRQCTAPRRSRPRRSPPLRRAPLASAPSCAATRAVLAAALFPRRSPSQRSTRSCRAPGRRCSCPTLLPLAAVRSAAAALLYHARHATRRALPPRTARARLGTPQRCASLSAPAPPRPLLALRAQCRRCCARAQGLQRPHAHWQPRRGSRWTCPLGLVPARPRAHLPEVH